MAILIEGQYALSEKGTFLENPWFLVKNKRVISRGFQNSPAGYIKIKLSDGVILPGFVNAHTHLELSPFINVPLKKHSGVHDFAFWLMSQRKFSEEEIFNEAEKLLKDARNKGTFYFIDLSNSPEFIKNFNNDDCFQGRHFLEILGYSPEKSALRLESSGKNPEIEVSPHSIYGSSPEIMEYCGRRNQDLISIHLLEEKDETGIFSESGRTWDFLKKIHQDYRHPEVYGNSLIHYLGKFFKKDQRLLFVHMSFADDDILRKIKKEFPNAGIVLCRRSNENLGYENHLSPEALQLDIPLLLGTDSAASSPDLSILNEIYHCIKSGIFPEGEIWKAATFNAYKFLGLDSYPWFFCSKAKPEIDSIIEKGFEPLENYY